MKPPALRLGFGLLLLASVAAPGVVRGQQARDRSPETELPPYIRRLTYFGERADFSPDGKRILFLAHT
ncbi:MAG TPA: hypothetical protein VFU47_01700, partial [Armatimonadota bacterium]|nr:hypothetical protein [Armatimonadota bacterium]